MRAVEPLGGWQTDRCSSRVRGRGSRAARQRNRSVLCSPLVGKGPERPGWCAPTQRRGAPALDPAPRVRCFSGFEEAHLARGRLISKLDGVLAAPAGVTELFAGALTWHHG